MRLTSVLAGSPLRTALWTLAVFVPALLLTGIALQRSLEATMLGEIESEVIAELVLFREILDREGSTALVETVQRMTHVPIRDPRLAAVFGVDGSLLAGGLDVAPDVMGWRTLNVGLQGLEEENRFRARVERWKDTTVVVGRSTTLVDATLASMRRKLFVAGSLVTCVCLLIGLVASRGTRTRLGQIATTLDRVADGECDARLPVYRTDDQIDRVSGKINVHLDRLSVLMAGMRRTIGAIAHDLRTPLNRASLRLQEARDELPDNSPAIEFLDDAWNEIDGLGEIVETVLRIGRIDASDDVRDFVTLSAAEFVSGIGEAFEPVAEEAGQQLEVLTTGNPAIRGDARMLRRMLANLVDNAIGHCPPGTRIRLVASDAMAGGARIVVEDSGKGIAAADLAHVLEPFVRLDASRNRPGTGLGLALVDAVVRRHRASLRLENAAPGLRVIIEFPPVN